MLIDTAQITMDLYYRDYKSDENFFDIDHFKYLCGVAYANILETEYKEARREARADEGATDVTLQSDWLVREVLEVKRSEDYPNTLEADLKSPLFSFPFDAYSYGIQSVRPIGTTGCRDLIRTSGREAWMRSQLPVTSRGFFYVIGKKLYLTNVRCSLKEIEIMQIPDIAGQGYGDTGGPIPKSKEDLIIRKTIELMMRTKEGAVVDTTNNSNPNTALQTEIAPNP